MEKPRVIFVAVLLVGVLLTETGLLFYYFIIFSRYIFLAD